MAIAGESANEMTDGNVSAGTRIEFLVLPSDHEDVIGLPPAIPGSPTVKEQTFVRRGIPVIRADGKSGGVRWTEWTAVMDGHSGLVAGDEDKIFPVLKRIHDDGKAVLGL